MWQRIRRAPLPSKMMLVGVVLFISSTILSVALLTQIYGCAGASFDDQTGQSSCDHKLTVLAQVTHSLSILSYLGLALLIIGAITYVVRDMQMRGRRK